MIDLLVHTATTSKISPAGHTIKVLSEKKQNVPYKSNTPIGSLDVKTIYIVPKLVHEIPVKKMPKITHQPFEQTFRLQVNLPRNQRLVLRVSPRTTLAEIKHQICLEKELDFGNHHLVHPSHPDLVLDLNTTLEDYGCAEISVMSNSGLCDSIRNSAAHLITYPRYGDERKKKGILRLFSRRKKDVSIEVSSNGFNNHELPSVRSTSSSEKPQLKQSAKRKPAPAPPVTVRPSSPGIIQSSSSINSRPESEVSAKTDELGSTVSHSRHSSDSSGYHEPSVFSDCSENKSPEAFIVHCNSVTVSGQESSSSKRIPDSQNLKKSDFGSLSESSHIKLVPSSNTSVTARKRKAPLPPSSVLVEVETPSSPEQQPKPAVQNTFNATEVSACIESIKDCENTNSSDVNCLNSGESGPTVRSGEYIETELIDSGKDVSLEISAQEVIISHHLEGNPIESEMDSQVELSSVCQSKMNESFDNDALRLVDMNLNLQSKSENSLENEIISVGGSASVPMPSINHDELIALAARQPDSSSQPSVPLAEKGENDNKDDSDDTQIIVNAHGAEKDNNLSRTVIQDNCSSPMNLNPSLDEDIIEKRPTVPKTILISRDVPQNTDNDHILNCTKKLERNEPDSVNSVDKCAVTSTAQQRLVNFAMGCYKSEENDVLREAPDADFSSSRIVCNSDSVISEQKNEVQNSVIRRYSPIVKIEPFQGTKSLELGNTKGQVQKILAELSNISTLPLTGRSASLYSLTSHNNLEAVKCVPSAVSESSILCINSEQNMSLEQHNEKESTFSKEQNQLQEDYLKLQSQFISWQKQLLNNQSLLLQNEVIGTSFPLLEKYTMNLQRVVQEPNLATKVIKNESKSEVKSQQNLMTSEETNGSTSPKSKVDRNGNIKNKTFENHHEKLINEKTTSQDTLNEDVRKSQTLPRQFGHGPSIQCAPRTMTLNRQVRPKSQGVAVTIGSWHQRNKALSDIEAEKVSISRSQYQGMKNILKESNEDVPEVLSQAKENKPTEGTPCSSVTKDHDSAISGESSLKTNPGNASLSKIIDRKKLKGEKVKEKSTKNEINDGSHENKNYSKCTKLLFQVSTMKDDLQPPPLQALKKWPFSEIKENTSKDEKQMNVFSKESHEKVGRAEVDLRKHRVEKRQPSPTIPKCKELFNEKNKSENGTSHITTMSKFELAKNSSSENLVHQKKPNEITSVGSQPFKHELKQTLSKRALTTDLKEVDRTVEEPTYAEARDSLNNEQIESVTVVTGSHAPPPPPVSTMPTIPPAFSIPKSSQLLIDNKSKQTKPKKSFDSQKDPREELMLEIRGFGGRQALRKVSPTKKGWQKKFYGSTSVVN